GAWFNLPAVLILVVVTAILVIGIRESAASNTALVIIKVGVVLFVIVAGIAYVNPANWTSIPPVERRQPAERAVPSLAGDFAKAETQLLQAARPWVEMNGKGDKVAAVTVELPDGGKAALSDRGVTVEERTEQLRKQAVAVLKIAQAKASGDQGVLKRARA